MESLNVDVVRALTLAPEFRDAAAGDVPAGDGSGDGSLGTLSGYFSAHGVWYEVDSLWEGTFLEQTAAGFATETIEKDRASMRVLFDHGFDSIGNKVLGPIDVLEDRAQGPYYEVPLFDTSYNRDLLPGLRAGQYGASFRFRVTADQWDDEPKASKHNPDRLPERTITRAKVMEFGPVTFPANPAASAQVRSVTDLYYEQLRRREPAAYDAAVRAAGRRLPTPLLATAAASRAVTRSTDATIEELVAAADALVDEVEEALEAGDVEQATALLTALDECIDSSMALLGLPDADEGDTSAASARPRAGRLHTLTGRPGARSAGGGGSKDDEPGNGPTSARTEAQARHHSLILKGVIRHG